MTTATKLLLAVTTILFLALLGLSGLLLFQTVAHASESSSAQSVAKAQQAERLKQHRAQTRSLTDALAESQEQIEVLRAEIAEHDRERDEISEYFESQKEHIVRLETAYAVRATELAQAEAREAEQRATVAQRDAELERMSLALERAVERNERLAAQCDDLARRIDALRAGDGG